MTEIIRAEPDDAGVLSAVIAEAFFDLPPSRWLISDEASRHKIFPAHFRIFVEHVLAQGIVHTTPDRAAAALWLQVGEKPPQLPDQYGERLREVTAPWTTRFTEFDAALDNRHLTGTVHHPASMPYLKSRNIPPIWCAISSRHDLQSEQVTSAPSNRMPPVVRSTNTDYGTPIHLHDGLLAGGDHLTPGQPDECPRMYPMVRRPKPHSE